MDCAALGAIVRGLLRVMAAKRSTFSPGSKPELRTMTVVARALSGGEICGDHLVLGFNFA